jgi:hypothetical protein
VCPEVRDKAGRTKAARDGRERVFVYDLKLKNQAAPLSLEFTKGFVVNINKREISSFNQMSSDVEPKSGIPGLLALLQELRFLCFHYQLQHYFI